MPAPSAKRTKFSLDRAERRIICYKYVCSDAANRADFNGKRMRRRIIFMSSKQSPWNLPNILSLSRVFLAPVILVFLTLRTQFGSIEGANVGDIIAGIVFIIASLTDAADGYIARKRNLVTNMGKFIDPIADKILVIAVLTSLVELHRFPAWMVVVIVSREFIVSGLRMVAASEGVVIAASKGGKLKTVTQIIGIIMLLFGIPFAMAVMWVAVLLTILSGVEYVIKSADLL
ncbi:CDP-diacylglycerol--glycerol-3-phosphate 3-phosphatidyltransferase [Synergistes jonesii]|uniref:CDP-diacylglycerol--glycerol-3-phosphate 3-phosphatidyltransferase n=2 Tax=Synergistes jonesii TaxID=2754 RepID=A0A073IPF0_9BACT|nr:CDP-diacylglycerol--glycerol-3-phosphate 3-phosphatidyltransferase [Synergistes jonesii]